MRHSVGTLWPAASAALAAWLLLATLASAGGMQPSAADEVDAVTIREVAKRMLDEDVATDERQKLVEQYARQSPELLAALIADIPGEAAQQYDHIPWIWRVTIAAGRRNDARELRRLLELSLPAVDAPLHDWQAVVLGGGLINGISLAGEWPKPRLAQLMADDRPLQARWRHALDEAHRMADNPDVRGGTRYDALRMIALDRWEKAEPALRKYLGKDAPGELQMGAVSGLSDIQHPGVVDPLIDGLAGYTARNRELALEALLRTPRRAKALLAAVDAGRVPAELVGDKRMRELRIRASE